MVGFDFFDGLGAILHMTNWTSVPSKLALWAYWTVDDKGNDRGAYGIKEPGPEGVRRSWQDSRRQTVEPERQCSGNSVH